MRAHLLRRAQHAAIPLAVAALAVAALAAGSGLTAQASAAPGWRIVKVFGMSSGFPLLQGVAASGTRDAWVSGTTTESLVIERWAGSIWQRLAVPGRFTITGSGGVNDGVIGASSAGNMWTFPQVSAGSGTAQYALHWNGSGWKSFRLRGTLGIFNTAVFGPSDVWAFGQAPPHQSGLGYGPPYAVRFNGHAWRRVSMPGDALSVSPLSADDIWAFGPTTKTAIETGTRQDRVAMHWNGTSWHTLAVPRYRMSGRRAFVLDVIALGRRNLWAVEGLPAFLCGCQPTPPGLILAHWNGRHWKLVRMDAPDVPQSGPAPDGHGGLWLTVLHGTSGAEEFLHYSGGRLIRLPEPGRKGFVTGIAGLALIPGTRSLWAVAGLTPRGPGSDRAAILRFIP
jgi:hypothetical protein